LKRTRKDEESESKGKKQKKDTFENFFSPIKKKFATPKLKLKNQEVKPTSGSKLTQTYQVEDASTPINLNSPQRFSPGSSRSFAEFSTPIHHKRFKDFQVEFLFFSFLFFSSLKFFNNIRNIIPI